MSSSYLLVPIGKRMNVSLRHRLLRYYWPTREFRATHDLPDHEVDVVRMKNRWRLERLRPYLWRWFVLMVCFGLIADLGNEMPHGALGFFVYIVGVTGFFCAGAMAVFWCWLYSLRPH
jgi:hypothetical protein